MAYIDFIEETIVPRVIMAIIGGGGCLIFNTENFNLDEIRYIIIAILIGFFCIDLLIIAASIAMLLFMFYFFYFIFAIIPN